LHAPVPAGENRPAGQVPVTAEAEHAEPAGQLAQVVAPVVAWYCPVGQLTHVVAPVAVWY